MKNAGGIARYQIDYILLSKKRFMNQVKGCRSYPGADVETDHNLVTMKILFRLLNLKTRSTRNWQTEEAYQQMTHEIRDNLSADNVEKSWTQIKQHLRETAEEILQNNM